jgi:hypothetical protein
VDEGTNAGTFDLGMKVQSLTFVLETFLDTLLAARSVLPNVTACGIGSQFQHRFRAT